MKHLLLTLWQLPQTLLGYLILVFTKHYPLEHFSPRMNAELDKEHISKDGIYIIDKDISISLGSIVLLSQDWVYKYYEGMRHGNETYRRYLMNLIRHEQGHQKQSLILGPLYLIVIGIPSAVMNALTRLQSSRYTWLKKIGHNAYYNYYKRYPEKWADRLGGVDRYE